MTHDPEQESNPSRRWTDRAVRYLPLYIAIAATFDLAGVVGLVVSGSNVHKLDALTTHQQSQLDGSCHRANQLTVVATRNELSNYAYQTQQLRQSRKLIRRFFPNLPPRVVDASNARQLVELNSQEWVPLTNCARVRKLGLRYSTYSAPKPVEFGKQLPGVHDLNLGPDN